MMLATSMSDDGRVDELKKLFRDAFKETLLCIEPRGLSQDLRSNLERTAALYFTKVLAQETPRVFQNQRRCIQEIMQVISGEVCWEMIFNEIIDSILDYSGCRFAGLRIVSFLAAKTYLEEQVDNSALRLEEFAKQAIEYVAEPCLEQYE